MGHLRDEDGWTPLTMASVHGHVDAARQLIAAGADLNAATRFGTTPLTFAGGMASVPSQQEGMSHEVIVAD